MDKGLQGASSWFRGNRGSLFSSSVSADLLLDGLLQPCSHTPRPLLVKVFTRNYYEILKKRKGHLIRVLVGIIVNTI